MKRFVVFLAFVAITAAGSGVHSDLAHAGGFPSFGLSPFPQISVPHCDPAIASPFLFGAPCDEPGAALTQIYEGIFR